MNCPDCRYEHCNLEHAVGNGVMVLSHIHKSLIHDHSRGRIRKADDSLYQAMDREIKRIEAALRDCYGRRTE